MLLNSGLWQRIRSFDFDHPGDDFPFSARLARENGWSRDFALRAINEYRKFMYLICVAPTPLTPSETVDQVWHLHLVYTRSYWAGFCDGILGRRIHHEPTKGGPAQAACFEDQYAATRRLYETEFGDLPPQEFWPPVAERFAATPRLQWVDRRRNWVLRKPWVLAGILPGLLVGTSVLALTLASGALQAATEATPAAGTELGNSDWVDAVIGWAFLAFVFVLFASSIIRGARNSDKSDEKSSWWFGGGSGCSGCGGCGGCGG